jgi:hypothetical protein
MKRLGDRKLVLLPKPTPATTQYWAYSLRIRFYYLAGLKAATDERVD